MTKRKKPEDKKPAGGPGPPSTYTSEMAARICDQIIEGRSLRSICDDEGMPNKKTVLKWLNQQPEFVTQYARAKDESAETHAEKIMDIADEPIETLENGGRDAAHVAHQRLRVDARKWIASKLKPKKYGDHVHTEVSGTLSLEQIVSTTGLPKPPADEQ